ncbi:MAG: hypothetical protein IJ460_04480 [Clostridia bacterium]|nr:hypothetical protein [Clostridia bacterium]
MTAEMKNVYAEMILNPAEPGAAEAADVRKTKKLTWFKSVYKRYVTLRKEREYLLVNMLPCNMYYVLREGEIAVKALEIERVIEKYSKYIECVINHTYFYLDSETKKDLYQAGLIGIWKALRKKHCDGIENSAIIYSYIRYEMSDFLRNNTLIRIPANHWKDYSVIKRILEKNYDITDEELESISSEENINISNYKNTDDLINVSSLDAILTDNADFDGYSFIPVYDTATKEFIDKQYIAYIIKSSFAGITSELDRRIIIKWLADIYLYNKTSRTGLSKEFGVSVGTVGSVINNFIDICCFIRDCEQAFFENSSGFMMMPKKQ